MIKISVITLCKNNEDTIADAMQSFRCQDYPHKEHIIIDGVSTDNTLNIVRQFLPDILVSEPDCGMYFAANKGISIATGDVIAFLHADDIFAAPNVLTKMAETIEQNNSQAAYADLCYVSKDNTDHIVRYWQAGKFSFKRLKYGWMPPHPTFFAKKSAYLQYGDFDTAFKIAADYDLMLRFLSKPDFNVSYCPITAVKMRVGGISNRSASNIAIKLKEDLHAARKNQIGGIVTLIFKNLRKINQFFKR